MREAAETRIQALKGELKDAHIELGKTETDLNEARGKIRTAVADFKKSPVFESFVESKRRQWISDFHRSTGFQVEMQQATLVCTNTALGKLNALQTEWNVFEEVKHSLMRQ